MNLIFWKVTALYFAYALLISGPMTYFAIWKLMDINFRIKNLILISMLTSIPYTIIYIILTTYFQELGYNIFMMLFNYFCNLIYMIAFYKIEKLNLTKLFISINLVSMLSQGVVVMILFFFSFFQTIYISFMKEHQLIATAIISYIFVPLVFILLFKLLLKLKLKEFLNASLYSIKSSIIMITLSVILPSLLFNVNLLDSFVENILGFRFPLLGILIILIEFIIIFYLSANGMSRMKIQSLETTTQQQQIYVQELEQMQQEMRIFKHDYKNMMSSIYLQTQEGQIEKVADFIEKSVINFDKKVGNKIKQSTQLQNVQIIEVKSLLLTKLLIMNDRGINCKLEVIYPVTEVNMILEEFITCLGILIDNAIEAVENTDKPEVEVLISAQKTCLTVMISNNSLDNIDCCQIFNYSYSTKGKNRGIGLFSYKQLTNKYTNIATSTSCNNKVFIQELKIRGMQ